MNLRDRLTDPRVIGPGVWFTIHQKAKEATTTDTKIEFLKYMQWVAHTFPCSKCAHHTQEYMLHNPIDRHWNVRSHDEEEIGCFRWSWSFHNAVNQRLDKPPMDWTMAYMLYYGVGQCSQCEVYSVPKGSPAISPSTYHPGYHASTFNLHPKRY